MNVESEQNVDPTRRVLSAVAEREGVDPIELEQPLFDVVDGDMLNLLLSSNGTGSRDASIEISFSYMGYDVSVAGSGSVDVTSSD